LLGSFTPENNGGIRVTVRFRPVREKKSIKDQRGWLVLNAARRQVIVASGPMMEAFPLSGSPVRPNDLAQEPEFLPRSSLRNGNSGRASQPWPRAPAIDGGREQS